MLMGCVSFQVRCRVCSLIRILNTSLLCMQIHRRQGALNTGFNTLFMKVCSAHLSLCVLHTWLSSYVSIAVCSAYLTVKLRLHHCVFRVPDCQAASPSLCVPRTWLSSCGDWTFLVTAVWIWNSFSGRSNLRSAERHDMFVPSTRTQLGRRSFHVAAPTVWNAFPSRLRSSSTSPGQFRAGLKTHLFTQAHRHLLELPLKSVLFYIYIYGSGTVFRSISLPVFCCHWKTYFFELCYP